MQQLQLVAKVFIQKFLDHIWISKEYITAEADSNPKRVAQWLEKAGMVIIETLERGRRGCYFSLIINL